MNKLSKLKEQYAKLGEEIEALENEFEPGWYAFWDNNTINTMGYLIGFIRTNEYLNEKLSSWDNVVKIDKDAFDKLLKPKTIYDWSKIPEWATIAVMDIDGNFCCGDYETVTFFTDDNCWWGLGSFHRGWVYIEEDCILNPPDDRRDSFERRPE